MALSAIRRSPMKINDATLIVVGRHPISFLRFVCLKNLVIHFTVNPSYSLKNARLVPLKTSQTEIWHVAALRADLRDGFKRVIEQREKARQGGSASLWRPTRTQGCRTKTGALLGTWPLHRWNRLPFLPRCLVRRSNSCLSRWQ